MSTIREVALKAGVSIATVSRVVNGNGTVTPKLRDRVLDAVNACGYAPTVGLRSEAAIALVYAGSFTVGSPYDAACLNGIVSAMLDSEYDLKIVHLRRDKKPEETYSQFFFRKGVHGAIVRCTSGAREVPCSLADEGFPTVVIGDHFEHPNLAFAFNESKKASLEGMEHLISLGHKRIAFATNDSDDGDHLDRFEAYREVLVAHGLYEEQLVFSIPAHRNDGAKLMRKVLSQPDPPTAIFIADPLVAEGAINGAHRVGVSIPGDISILGFDDTDTRNSVYPEMTAICQDSQELGRRAFELLVRRSVKLSGEEDSIFLGEAWLEVNHTTGWARSHSVRVMPNGDRPKPVEQ